MITEKKENYNRYVGDNEHISNYFPRQLNVKQDYNATQLFSFKNIPNDEILWYQRNKRSYNKDQIRYDYKKPKVARFKLYFRCPFYKRTFYSYDNYYTKDKGLIMDEEKALKTLTTLAIDLNSKFGKDAESLFFMCLDHEKRTKNFDNHNELCQIITKGNFIIRNSTLNFKTFKKDNRYRYVDVNLYTRQYLK